MKKGATGKGDPHGATGWGDRPTSTVRRHAPALATRSKRAPPAGTMKNAGHKPGIDYRRHDRRGDRAHGLPRQRMIRVTPRPRGSAIASGVLPSILITWMSPLKSCPFSV